MKKTVIKDDPSPIECFRDLRKSKDSSKKEGYYFIKSLMSYVGIKRTIIVSPPSEKDIEDFFKNKKV